MKLYECEGKEILKEHGLAVPGGGVAASREEAKELAGELGRVVIKAQVLSGGRGKAGLIRKAASPAQAAAHAADLLGREFRGSEVIARLLVEEEVPLERELYLSLTIDRKSRRPLILACGRGGMEIEEIATKYPGELFRELIDPLLGVQSFQVRKLAGALGLKDLAHELGRVLTALAEVFRRYQAVLVEINPLGLTAEGRLVALDAKLELDDALLDLRPDVAGRFADRSAFLIGPELRALQVRRQGVNAYVEMDGSIAVVGNGASLGMISMDLLARLGGRPACFCDLGGNSGATVKAAVETAVQGPHVKAVFVNVVGGGITRLDAVSQALSEYARESGGRIPVVARLKGLVTQADLDLLKEAGVQVFEDSLAAARRVLELAV